MAWIDDWLDRVGINAPGQRKKIKDFAIELGLDPGQDPPELFYVQDPQLTQNVRVPLAAILGECGCSICGHDWAAQCFIADTLGAGNRCRCCDIPAAEGAQGGEWGDNTNPIACGDSRSWRSLS
jgi:hypothetical protein